MKANSFLLLLVIVCAFQQVSAQGQTREQRESAASAQVEGELRSLFGPTYYAPFVYEVDSLLGYNGYFLDPLDDPYGTLKGCFIFVGGPDISHGNVVGVYKDGRVLWHSDTLKCYSNLNLFTAQDLNNDETVDLVFEAGVEEAQLWIFSWDGQTGRRINSVDEDGSSVIEGHKGYFSFIDVEGDGIWEIRDGAVEDGTASWSWNGQEYGHWPSTPNTAVPFPPRNKIDVSVTCRIDKRLDTVFFNYQILNKPSSKQRVIDFRIWCKTFGVYHVFAPPFWSCGYINGWEFIWWDALTSYHTGHIRVGRSMGGYAVESKSLCTISSFDSHGYNSVGKGGLFANPENSEAITKDDLENAYWGKTIGPADPPSPFVPIDFVDTLSGFTTQSRSLGWITSQQIADKYLGYFASAKSQLQGNNTAGARATLQTVLQDVNVDSTSNLTTEAYALIRYNTEYLLGQLPVAPPPGLVVKLINSAGTNLTGGALQYYDGSWKDAVNNNDGTFKVNTTLATVSLRMTYEYASQTKSNVTVGPEPVVFQTVNTLVKLQNSVGSPIDIGTVQYYFSAWKDFGATTNGTAAKELLPGNYTFRMSYAAATNDKQQDIGIDPTVVFTTVNAAVQLKNSQGDFIDQGSVQVLLQLLAKPRDNLQWRGSERAAAGQLHVQNGICFCNE